MKIIVFISGFVLGILISSLVSTSPLTAMFFILIGGGSLIGEKIWMKEIRLEVFLICVALIAFGSGILRYEIKDFYIPDPNFSSRVNENIEFIGVVVDEPERRDKDTRIVVETNAEKILVSTDMYAEVSYGDEVTVVGKLKKPERIIDEATSESFNYPEYLAKDDIYYTISYASVERVSSGHGSWLRSRLIKAKQSLMGKTKLIFPESESSLLSGLILSGKDAMPKAILDEFQRAGVVHIVVLSGYNITIIADFLRRLFSFLSFKLSSGISVFGIFLFVLMTGGSATVVRAAIMAVIAISGKLFGRNYSASRALMGAGFIMLLHNPKILVFDPSFQLSFLATLALIYVTPHVESRLEFINDKRGVRGVVATTIATQITVLPYLMYNMGNVSLVAIISNLLILLIIPLTMLTGFIATLVSYMSLILSWPVAFVAHVLLSWILGVSRTLGNLPFSSVEINHFPLWITIVFYLALFLIFAALSHSNKEAKQERSLSDSLPLGTP